jgi:hypothetical protein
VSNAETTKNKINYDIERIAKNNVLNSSVIIRLLDNLEMDDPLSSLIKETLKEVIDKYKITENIYSKVIQLQSDSQRSNKQK